MIKPIARRTLAKLSALLTGTLRADIASSRDVQDRILMLAAATNARQLATIERVDRLFDVEYQVHSQFGEDGIIEWLVQRLMMAHVNLPQTFVEFGVEDYSEANTLYLLKHRNWRGLVLDGDPRNIERLRQRALTWRHDLKMQAIFVTRDNINNLMTSLGTTGEIGILSIDIDGNDYWVWEAIDCIAPAIVICEYNAVFGDIYPLTVPYHPAFVRRDAHYSMLYSGCSIEALKILAKRKGYTLLGSNGAGNNAFFVRDSLAGTLTSVIADTSAHPSLFRESRDADGKLTCLGGIARVEPIADMPLVNLATGAPTSLRKLDRLYSQSWANRIAGES